jgi:hypothetical protein
MMRMMMMILRVVVFVAVVVFVTVVHDVGFCPGAALHQ